MAYPLRRPAAGSAGRARPCVRAAAMISIEGMLRDRSLVSLSRQHHDGLALCVLTERSLSQDPGPENAARLARETAGRFASELKPHFEAEEGILLPAARELEPALVEELMAEHRRLEAMAHELAGEPSAARLPDFTALLRAHIRKEENELFERIQKELPRRTLDALGERLEAAAARVCPRIP